MEKIVRTVLIGLIYVYQVALSPFIGRECRFHPTCSNYAKEALRTHGAWRGSILAIKRVMRCHPWGECGIDPVPDAPKGEPTRSRDNEHKK